MGWFSDDSDQVRTAVRSDRKNVVLITPSGI